MTTFAFKGMAAAAGLALTTMASPASAAFLVHLNSSAMDTSYTANINYGSIHETAYSNGVNFNVTEVVGGDTYDLFSFCIDIFHNMSLGGLNDFYVSTYGDEPNPPLHDGSGGTLNALQTQYITTLVDIGFILHRDNPGDADASLRTAAIQAAIWEIEHPGSITLNNAGASAGGSGTYGSYFHDYLNLNGAGNRIFTLTDATYGSDHETNHQGFVVGWPPEGGVPEPATWGLMLLGFLGAGAAIRRQRQALAG